jgi:hypothetical protein
MEMWVLPVPGLQEQRAALADEAEAHEVLDERHVEAGLETPVEGVEGQCLGKV